MTSAIPTASQLASDVRSVTLRSLAEIEREHAAGRLRQWRQVIAADRTATLFQTPMWYLPWYRHYEDDFEPVLIAACEGDRLIGYAPLAIERATRRLTFAGDNMADYRDFVSAPDERTTVTRDALRFYRAGDFASPFELGSLQPASPTVAVAAGLCAEAGLRVIERRHEAWRWWPPAKKKPIRHLNFFERLDGFGIAQIQDAREWDRFKSEFYDQHCLRQISAGRSTSFDSPRKQAFHEALLREPDSIAHVMVMHAGERLLAAHFGFVWNGIAYFGAPAYDILLEHRSPALVLMQALLRDAVDVYGLRGLDLTRGNTGFKRRIGTEQVELPLFEVYRDPVRYGLSAARKRAADTAKSLVAKKLGPEAWESKVLPAAERVRNLGRRTPSGEPVLYRLERAPHSTAAFELRTNCVRDFLLAPATTQVTAAIAAAPALVRRDGWFYTALEGEKLAGWCFCGPAENEPAFVIERLFVFPEFRRRGLARQFIAECAARAGCKPLYAACDPRDRGARELAAAVGFVFSDPKR